MAEYIEREAVINITAETGAWETQNRVRELPSADVQSVKRGKWELTNNPSFRKCSECGAWWSSNFTDSCFTNYCPRCGARMDGDTNG